MPKITQITQRSAISSLLASDLEVGEITYEDNIGKDMVLKIFIAGNEISEGDLVPKKSKIDLVLGNGQISENKMIEDKVLESDLFEHYQFTADKGQEPLRVDKYLMNRVENATRNKIQNAAKEGSIYVNDKIVKSNYKVNPEI